MNVTPYREGDPLTRDLDRHTQHFGSVHSSEDGLRQPVAFQLLCCFPDVEVTVPPANFDARHVSRFLLLADRYPLATISRAELK